MSLLLDIIPRIIAPQSNACHICGALLTERESVLCGDCQRGLNDCRIEAVEAVGHVDGLLSLNAFWHQDEARTLVHRLKFGHDLWAAEPLAHGMCGAWAEAAALPGRVDGVTAVPVHASRLRSRGYNQAEVLAEAFCRHTGLPYRSDVLKRLHHSHSQVGRGREQRLSAMEGAFEASPEVQGLALLLIDDVLTTGATASACAHSLLSAGAVSVTVLTACKA